MVSNQRISVYGTQRENIEADLMAQILLLAYREQQDANADADLPLAAIVEELVSIEEQKP
jgi:hypothetical protein